VSLRQGTQLGGVNTSLVKAFTHTLDFSDHWIADVWKSGHQRCVSNKCGHTQGRIHRYKLQMRDRCSGQVQVVKRCSSTCFMVMVATCMSVESALPTCQSLPVCQSASLRPCAHATPSRVMACSLSTVYCGTSTVYSLQSPDTTTRTTGHGQ